MALGFALALETTMAPSASWTGRWLTISEILCFFKICFIILLWRCWLWQWERLWLQPLSSSSPLSVSACGGILHHSFITHIHNLVFLNWNAFWLDLKFLNLSPSSVQMFDFVLHPKKKHSSCPKIWHMGAISWFGNVQIEHYFRCRGHETRYWMSSLQS